MTQFISAIFLFSICWAALRALFALVQQGRMPARMPWAFGIAAWGSVLGALFFVYTLIEPLVTLFSSSDFVQLAKVGAFWFLTSFIGYAVAKYPGFLDWERMKAPFQESLFFHDPTRHRDDIFERAAFEKVRSIHEEQTGKILQREQFRTTERPSPDTSAIRKDLEEARPEAVQNPQLAEDLVRLKAGESVNVTDVFRLNSYRRKTHPRYDQIQLMLIEPDHGRLRFKIVFPDLVPGTIADADGRFRTLQEIYEVLYALQSELWFISYERHVATLQADCFRVETDSFDMPTQVPFARVFLPLAEIRAHTDKLFIVTELTRLNRVEWIS